MNKLLRTNLNAEDGKIKIDVHLEDETVWLTQKKMAELFGVDVRTISEHLQNTFLNGELLKDSVIRKFRNTASDGKGYETQFYNLDAIISVGYKVNSLKATQFRIWATKVLREYIIKGFTLNDERFKTGNSMNYFNELQERLREIRISERFFYQKIKDIYATSIDYDPKDEKTIEFLKLYKTNCFGRSAVKQPQNLFTEEQTPLYPYWVCNLMTKILLVKSGKVILSSPRII